MRRYHVWIKLALLLALLHVWVERVFVPGWLAHKYRDPYPILSSHSVNLGVLFALLPPPAPPENVVVVLVGDSTIRFNGGLAKPLAAQLTALLGRRSVQVIDMSVQGMHAPDALVCIAKAFGIDPDLVIYAMSPRVVPTAPEFAWATGAGDLALEPDVVRRLGVANALALVPPGDLGRTLVYSLWAPARLRTALAEAIWEQLPRPGESYEGLVWLTQPRTQVKIPWEEKQEGEPYRWPRARYRADQPTRAVRALDAIIDLCGREGRCLLYQVPINPRGTRGFEPGLVDEFVDHVSHRATAADVSFADLRGALTEKSDYPDDPIHPRTRGHARFAASFAPDVVAHLRASQR